MVDANNQIKVIIIGYYKGTVFASTPGLAKKVSDEFKKRNAHVIYWTDDAPSDVWYIPLVRFNIKETSKDVIGSIKRLSWIYLANISWRRIESKKIPALISSIENNSEYLFSTFNPALFIGWNTMEFIFGTAADVFRQNNVPVINMETGIIINSLRFDLEHFANEITFPGFDKVHHSLGSEIIKSFELKEHSLYPQLIDHLEIDTISSARRNGKKIILVLGMVESDVGVNDTESEEKRFILPNFLNSYDVAEWAARAKDTFVIYKPHPLYRIYSPYKLKRRGRVNVMKTDPIALIEHSDIVICCFTKLILPAILSRKIVITIGGGFFNGYINGIRISDGGELIKRLESSIDYDYDLEIKKLCALLGYYYSTNWLLLSNTDSLSIKSGIGIEELTIFLLGKSNTNTLPLLILDEKIKLINSEICDRLEKINNIKKKDRYWIQILSNLILRIYSKLTKKLS